MSYNQYNQNRWPEEDRYVEITRREYDEYLQLRSEKDQERQYGHVDSNTPNPNDQAPPARVDNTEPSSITDDTGSSIDWDFGLQGGIYGQDTNIDEDMFDGEINDDISGLRGETEPKNLLFDTLCEVLQSQDQRHALCSLQGRQAQVIIDYLYTVLLEPRLPQTWLRRHCLIALYKLSKSSLLYPRCYTLKETISFGSSPIRGGSYSDIYRGRISETELCLKVVRLPSEKDTSYMLRIYAKEAILWGQLRHPNIVPFYGLYYRDEIRRELCLVSPWMRYGDLGEYLRTHSSPYRASLSYDVVSGLGYLHKLGLIHSDFKSTNILVNDLERALITDFGMSFIRTDKTLADVVVSKEVHGGSTRWSAPELFDAEARNTMASDIWALGCVLYQIMTGRSPFAQLSADFQIVRAILSGEKPGTPAYTSDSREQVIWEEIDHCFETNPTRRPNCQDIKYRFQSAGISWISERAALNEALRKRQDFLRATRIESENSLDIDEVRRVLGNLKAESAHSPRDPLIEVLSDVLRNRSEKLNALTSAKAQVMIDYLYSVLSNPVLRDPWLRDSCNSTLYKLCQASQLYPNLYKLKESIILGSQQPSHDTFSDILKGWSNGKELCFKAIRVYGSDLKSMLKIYAKEAIMWGQLHHPNVTPFYGIYYLNQYREQICLVSPWMSYGNLVDYLKDRPYAPRELFVYDVVAGLSYLHERGLVHSDLKGTNILVNDIERACITDFGTSLIWTDETLVQSIDASTVPRPTTRWVAPELLQIGARPTLASDVWALGCVCSEILTGKLPYHFLKAAPQIIVALLDGRPPIQPIPFNNSPIIWQEVVRCWTVNPVLRSTSQDFLNRLIRAGISRGENDQAQRNEEQEVKQIQDALRMDREEPFNLEEVKAVFEEVRTEESRWSEGSSGYRGYLG